MKTCFKCGESKPPDEFYEHPQMADGHLGKCKDCTKYDVLTARHENPHVREYDRARTTQPRRVMLRAQITKRHRAEHPERTRAAAAAQRAKLIRPVACEGCGRRVARLEKHHHNYARPLAVVWLCKPCHAIADKIRRRMEMAS